ncbi:hypothetical protein [Mycoplasma enhydrae]|uniref:hypothetical protein n=1 Tax=Mycoplasma enhydrae TaxID=2499220 RepID=UPI00197BD61E|nr:hypothetical protein [Mycoplasma enhydrae]MBN4089720.1 hypothetical protein [Mycoplasma enhydrae]MCV3733432.1 hypothetical protein [Mycoplasma enhydrae]
MSVVKKQKKPTVNKKKKNDFILVDDIKKPSKHQIEQTRELDIYKNYGLGSFKEIKLKKEKKK